MTTLAFAPTFSVATTRRRRIEGAHSLGKEWKLPTTTDGTPSWTRSKSAKVPPLLALPLRLGVWQGRSTTWATTTATATTCRPSLVLTLTALLVGIIVGRITRRGARSLQRLSNTPTSNRALDEPLALAKEMAEQEKGRNFVVAESQTLTPIWLNYALARIWALFQRNTDRLLRETIQPVLDKTEKPSIVTAVRVVKFKPGRQSPFVRSLQRLPSRALATVQYSLRTKFSSTSELEFQLDLSLLNGTLPLTLPVTLSNLDVDSQWWTSFQLAPYEPFCTAIQVALLEPPTVSFDMVVARVIPITALPLLRSFFFRVVTLEIPKVLLYPRVVAMDFTPPEIIRQAEQCTRKEESIQIDKDGTDSAATVEQLKARYPEQYALFDALDLDDDGSLSPLELAKGLQDWGYTATDARETFATLDVNDDQQVTLAEFCHLWPRLVQSFVPSRYKGSLTIFLRQATDLKYAESRRSNIPTWFPLLSFSQMDPYVDFALGEQFVSSKRDTQTSRRGEAGNPVWMESYELNCMDLTQDVLQLEIRNGSKRRRKTSVIGRATIALDSLLETPRRQLKVQVEPQGSIFLDLYYSDFVESLCAT